MLSNEHRLILAINELHCDLLRQSAHLRRLSKDTQVTKAMADIYEASAMSIGTFPWIKPASFKAGVSNIAMARASSLTLPPT